MKIGAISDTHDNLAAVAAALRRFQEAGVEVILHAGDYVAPFALKRLIQAAMPVHGVFGNCDGERTGLAKLLPELSDGPRRLELGGKKICLVHVEKRLTPEDFEASDIIVCGHTHEPKVQRQEGRLIVNPGECGGWLTGRCTVAVIDTQTLAADVHEVFQQAR
ncbi:MAG: metallophosphoesterase [Planctomycetes bacterium]|nr:metallophosphoesterase [Planctomycetota bacterium]